MPDTVSDPDFPPTAFSNRDWSFTDISSTDFSYLWIINNFRLLENKKVGQDLKSSTFSVTTENLKTEWQLKIYPNGDKDTSEGSISLFLMLVKPKDIKLFCKFTLSIVNLKKERINVHTYWGDLGSLGYTKFIKRTDLISRAYDLLPNDRLTICCDLSIANNNIATQPEVKTDVSLKAAENVCEDFRSLLESKMLSDVTLKVQEKEFHVHKNILSARSPVFAAMFQNDMKESEENVVTITDTDVETFENVLVYVYSGKTPLFTSYKKIKDFLYVADKYEMVYLKTMCEVALSKALTVANATEILMAAEKHDATFLKENTKKFIIKKAAEVVETEHWKNIELYDPVLAVEILHAAVKK